MPSIARPLMKVGEGIGHFLFKMSKGRMKIQGRDLLVLTTIGAKTAKTRQTILARFDDPEHPGAIWVVGSNAGSIRHPGWCYNLARNPDQVWVDTRGVRLKVRPDSLVGAERENAWKRVVELAPGYGRYPEKTDREIPIIRLTPERAEPSA